MVAGARRVCVSVLEPADLHDLLTQKHLQGLQRMMWKEERSGEQQLSGRT